MLNKVEWAFLALLVGLGFLVAGTVGCANKVEAVQQTVAPSVYTQEEVDAKLVELETRLGLDQAALSMEIARLGLELKTERARIDHIYKCFCPTEPK